jgi:hypothetical protein
MQSSLNRQISKRSVKQACQHSSATGVTLSGVKTVVEPSRRSGPCQVLRSRENTLAECSRDSGPLMRRTTLSLYQKQMHLFLIGAACSGCVCTDDSLSTPGVGAAAKFSRNPPNSRSSVLLSSGCVTTRTSQSPASKMARSLCQSNKQAPVLWKNLQFVNGGHALNGAYGLISITRIAFSRP